MIIPKLQGCGNTTLSILFIRGSFFIVLVAFRNYLPLIKEMLSWQRSLTKNTKQQLSPSEIENS